MKRKFGKKKKSYFWRSGFLLKHQNNIVLLSAPLRVKKKKNTKIRRQRHLKKKLQRSQKSKEKENCLPSLLRQRRKNGVQNLFGQSVELRERNKRIRLIF